MVEINVNTILEIKQLQTELDVERASQLKRSLRLLSKNEPEEHKYKKHIRHINELIEAYELKFWANKENISDELVASSDKAENIVDHEAQAILKRKDLIRFKMKEMNMNQTDLAQVLGHSKGYTSELINGVRPLSKKDIRTLNYCLKISVEDLEISCVPEEDIKRIKKVAESISNPYLMAVVNTGCIATQVMENIILFFTNKSKSRIEKLKLIKLIWLSDRLHLNKTGRMILHDRYYAMPYGPVASDTYDLTRSGLDGSFSVDRFNILSHKESKNEQWSESEIFVLEYVWKRFGGFTSFELKDYSHKFKEWKRYERRILDSERPSSYIIEVQDMFEPLEGEDFSDVYTEEERLNSLDFYQSKLAVDNWLNDIFECSPETF